MSAFYGELTGRNAGFVTPEEQDLLRRSAVFVCGVGGMGGAAVSALVRAGVGYVTIADQDRFEVSNLNRQTFAFVDTVGRSKTEVTDEAIRRINPNVCVRTLGAEWVEELDGILPSHRVVVNAMDDIRAGIQLYRKAREHGATVIDAYLSPSPSVTVVGPADPRPEERLGFPTVGILAADLTDAHIHGALAAEIAYVTRTSRGVRHLDRQVVEGIVSGRLPRSSFAPTVMIAGNLMAFEALMCLVGRTTGTGCEGYFLDLWEGRVERPGSN